MLALRHFFSIALMIATAFAASAGAASAKPAKEMPRTDIEKLVAQMRQPLAPGQIGPRSLTDGTHETPDPTRPVPVTLLNGEKAFFVGLSGQQGAIVSNLSDLRSGIKQLIKVELYNENGFRYGGEPDPATGQPLGYALDSTTWDITLGYAMDDDGKGMHLMVFAGAMGNDADGKPLLYKAGQWTRRRVFFHDVKFESRENGELVLVARAPTSPFTKTLPTGPDWVLKDKDGNFIFNHGYGGEPVTLPNGELYIDERGWVPVIHESVIEQRMLPDSTGKVRSVPFVTVLSVTYMDPTLTKVMQQTKTVLTPFKKDGSTWKAAERPNLGPLVEGAHIDVYHNGQPVQSMADVNRIRKAGGKFDFQMLFSAGEYYADYGSFVAHASGRPEDFEPLTDSKNELFNLTANLGVLFLGEGRPVLYRDELGGLNLLTHGSALSGFPEGMVVKGPGKNKDLFQYLKRELQNIPVKEYTIGKFKVFRPIDNTGIYHQLRPYLPKTASLAEPRENAPKKKTASEAFTSPRSKARDRAMSCTDIFRRVG